MSDDDAAKEAAKVLKSKEAIRDIYRFADTFTLIKDKLSSKDPAAKQQGDAMRARLDEIFSDGECELYEHEAMGADLQQQLAFALDAYAFVPGKEVDPAVRYADPKPEPEAKESKKRKSPGDGPVRSRSRNLEPALRTPPPHHKYKLKYHGSAPKKLRPTGSTPAAKKPLPSSSASSSSGGGARTESKTRRRLELGATPVRVQRDADDEDEEREGAGLGLPRFSLSLSQPLSRRDHKSSPAEQQAAAAEGAEGGSPSEQATQPLDDGSGGSEPQQFASPPPQKRSRSLPDSVAGKQIASAKSSSSVAASGRSHSDGPAKKKLKLKHGGSVKDKDNAARDVFAWDDRVDDDMLMSEFVDPFKIRA